MNAKGERRRLVVFDVEGVILPKRWYLLLEPMIKLNFYQFLTALFLGFLYESSLVSLEFTLKRLYSLFKGVTVEELFGALVRIPLIPGAEKAFRELKQEGSITALISSGLPKLFIDALAKRLGADYSFGLEVETAENHLTGNLFGIVLKPRGKALILGEILAKEGRTSPVECIVVADDRNNIQMFPVCDKTIGYNPDFSVSAKCDYVVEGDLQQIVPFLANSPMKLNVGVSKDEAFRKVIHIGSFLIPLFCLYLNVDRFTIAAIITVVTITYAISELKRMRNFKIPIFSTITLKAAKSDEKWNFAPSPIFFALGIILSLTVFPSRIGYTSIALLTLGDGSAPIVGKIFGRVILPFNKSKSLEGTIFGFILAFSGAILFTTPLKAMIASAIGMIVESIPSPINDNLSMPIISGLIIMAMP